MDHLPLAVFGPIDRGNAQRHRNELLSSRQPNAAAFDVDAVGELWSGD
jgi:hypothetical protein